MQEEDIAGAATAEDIELQATTEQHSKSGAAAEVSASQPEVDENALNTMLAMGLQRQHRVIALRRSNGDPNAATEFCSRPKFCQSHTSSQDTNFHSKVA